MKKYNLSDLILDRKQLAKGVNNDTKHVLNEHIFKVRGVEAVGQ